MDDRFLNTDLVAGEQDPLAGLRALSKEGGGGYVGLETFPNPGCHSITFSGDELVAHCPVTGQPDFYEFQIVLLGTEKSIESKSLKMWLRQFADPPSPGGGLQGLFCESLAVFIRDQVGEVLGLDPQDVEQHIQVTLKQKSRGGISIRSVA
jgi:NADPH-dependent 7-cyano-7-deazaguanine reductase QueF